MSVTLNSCKLNEANSVIPDRFFNPPSVTDGAANFKLRSFERFLSEARPLSSTSTSQRLPNEVPSICRSLRRHYRSLPSGKRNRFQSREVGKRYNLFTPSFRAFTEVDLNNRVGFFLNLYPAKPNIAFSKAAASLLGFATAVGLGCEVAVSEGEQPK